MDDDLLHGPFRDAHQDVETAESIPQTPQTQSPAYRLAFDDASFLCRDELRPVRLQLELLKPELLLDEQQIESTVVMFGGARIPEPAQRDSARTETLAQRCCTSLVQLATISAPGTCRMSGRDGSPWAHTLAR